MSNYERIKTAVMNSNIPEEDKFTTIDIFAQIANEHLGEIAELFEEKSEWVSIYNENRKKKQTAFQSGEESAWNAILEEEKKLFEKLVYDSD